MAELSLVVEGVGLGLSYVQALRPDVLLTPLSARSVVASTLLGTHPPRLPGRLLVALGNEFGISPGTTRVAMSRMVERGELVNDGGAYRLAGHLLERQERQDRSRRPTRSWDRAWECAIVIATNRSASERTRLRTALSTLGLGERREGVWMRPANLDPERMLNARLVADTQVEWHRLAPLDSGPAAALAGELFDLEGWAADARLIISALRQATVGLADVDRPESGQSLTRAFTAAAAALRHFVHDPLLPTEVEPATWPGTELHLAFDQLDGELKTALRSFFRSVARAAPSPPNEPDRRPDGRRSDL